MYCSVQGILLSPFQIFFSLTIVTIKKMYMYCKY